MTTPGPWHYEGHYILSDGPVDPDRPERGSEIIAERVSEANRGLIASAPTQQAKIEALADALEAAREIVRTAEVEGSDHGDRCRGLAQLKLDAGKCMATIRAALKAAGRIP